MWQTEASIDVAAPAQEVYGYLSDFRRHKEWSLGVAEIEQTNGDMIAVGAEFEAVEKVPVRFTSYSRITRLEPPRWIEWSAWDGRAFQVSWAFEITASVDSTRVVQRACVQPQNLLGRALLLALRKRQIPKENAQSLLRLKSLLEE
jgi:hypothetical protein